MQDNQPVHLELDLTNALRALSRTGLRFLEPLDWNTVDRAITAQVLIAVDEILLPLNNAKHRKTLAGPQEYMDNRRPFSCKIVVAKDRTPFAFAYASKRGNIVVISWGQILSCLVISYRLESAVQGIRKESCKETTGPTKSSQDISLDQRISQLIEGAPPTSKEIAEASSSLPTFPPQKGGSRKFVALFFDMLRLIVAHEVFHIILGHSGYAQARLSLGPMMDGKFSEKK